MLRRKWDEHEARLKEQFNRRFVQHPVVSVIDGMILCFENLRMGWSRMTRSRKRSLTGISGHTG